MHHSPTGCRGAVARGSGQTCSLVFFVRGREPCTDGARLRCLPASLVFSLYALFAKLLAADLGTEATLAAGSEHADHVYRLRATLSNRRVNASLRLPE